MWTGGPRKHKPIACHSGRPWQTPPKPNTGMCTKTKNTNIKQTFFKDVLVAGSAEANKKKKNRASNNNKKPVTTHKVF